MKKIMSYIFIAQIALLISNSLCMLTVFTKPSFRSSKALFYTQQRTLCSILTLKKQYIALCKENKRNQQRLNALRKDPYANIRDRWRLENTITKNRRILATLKVRIIEESAE